MKKVQVLFCFAALLFVCPVRAQYAGSTQDLVDDMLSTSSYTATTKDTAACDYRTWTPSRNGYRITGAGAARPDLLGRVQHMGTLFRPAEMHRFTAVSLSAVGADSPYSEPSTPSSMSRPRRVSAEGGLGEPGAKELPVGDMPWWMVLLVAAGYVLRRPKRVCKAEK